MRHVTLTCKNHPNLRWSCKEIAFSDGHGYNGCRNIFFYGDIDGNREIVVENGKVVWLNECDCSPRDLIRAPEDRE